MKIFIFVSLLCCAACAPKIYVVDRETVLQEESAGEWPAFEKKFIPKLRAKTPQAKWDAKGPAPQSKETLYQTLEGDLSSGGSK